MPKKGNNLNDLLARKSPTTLRNVPIQKVSIIEEAERLGRTGEEEKKPVDTPGVEDRPTQAMVKSEPSDLPQKGNVKSDEGNRATLASNQSEIIPPPGEETVVSEEQRRTIKPNEVSTTKDAEVKRNIKPRSKTVRNERTKKPRVYSGRDIEALLALDKRPSERYSFEIYSDQKEDIQRVCELYEEKTGQHLSASRLIREVLDSFLPGALKTFGDE